MVMPWDHWDLDHFDIPVALGGDDKRLRPAHRSCNRKAGRELGAAIKRAGITAIRQGMDAAADSESYENDSQSYDDGITAPVFERPSTTRTHSPRLPIPPDTDLPPQWRGIPPEYLPPGVLTPDIPATANGIVADQGAVTPRPDSSVWTKTPWVRELAADIPDSAQWPRLMSRPHPEAVGTYGPDAADWMEREADIRLRWWQRLVVYRALEHDAAGQLVWTTVVLSTARQVGKSVLVRALALWRTNNAELFGEPQLVLHTGKDLNVCREVHRPGRTWARNRGYFTRETNGQEEIRLDDESRWIVRGSGSVYGYAATMAIADEAWAMSARLVEDGLEPTMMERLSPQLVLLSTAHSRASSLMLGRRAAALDAWESPSDSLLVEWSAPAGTDIADRDAWRQASPHWSDGRARLLEARYRRCQAGVSDPDDADDDPERSFRSQVLNTWPAQRLAGTGRDESLVAADVWASAADLAAVAPPGPVVVAVEDWYGLGAAAVVAAPLDGGRVLVWGETFTDRADALAWADMELHSDESREGSELVVGASLNPAAVSEALGIPAGAAGNGHTRVGLPMVRAMVNAGQLIHGGDRTLSGQMTACRVTARDGGLVITNRGVRGDLVRATAWAVMVATRPSGAAIPFFVY
jgi:hypothetical protein